MAKICEKLIEEISSNPDSLSQEMQKHILTCSECRASIEAVKKLKSARKGLSAKEASSIATILTAVKNSAPDANADTLPNTTSLTGVATVFIAALVAITALVLAPNDNQQKPIGKDFSDKEFTTPKMANDEIKRVESEYMTIEPFADARIKLETGADFSSSNSGFTLSNGHAIIEAQNRKKSLTIETPLATIELKGAKAEITSSANGLKIKVETGEVRVIQKDDQSELLLTPGQSWSISAEKNNQDAVGTILVSPDQEDID